MLAQDIRAGLEAAQKAKKLPARKKIPTVIVEHSKNAEYGDYSSPIAMTLAKKLKKPPLEIVQAIAEHMPKKEYLGRMKAVSPGYLNMWLNPGWLTARLDNIIGQDLCDDITVGGGRTVNLEFISANPTGPLTLANIRTAFSIDTLGNVLECAGFDVTREYYSNDTGNQVRRLGESVLRRVLQDQGEKVDFPEDLYQGDYVSELAAVIAERWREDEDRKFTTDDLEGDAGLKIGKEAVDLILVHIKQTIKDDLRIKFDVWTSERDLHEGGLVQKVLDRLESRGATRSKDGAVYLRTKKGGDDQDRVLVKSDGEKAYVAADIANHQAKYDRKFDLIFTVVGADHQGHLPKIEWAMTELGNDISKLHFIVAQWFRLVRDGKPVKLSKRQGEIYEPKDLIAEVGYDAARFFLVQQRLDMHMDFNVTLAKEQSERNPVYYVQYAYVRLQSILRRAKEHGVISDVGLSFDLSDNPALTHTLELNVMRQLYRFPEVVGDIATTFDVHSLTYYAIDLAKAIHVYYRHVPVLAAEEESLVMNRLQLVLAARGVLGQTLDLLGVSKPDVM